ncbi:MAG: hypothetical protein JWR60_3076 [Polaromonas sp.]|nr:hypothetical protein [Polaromonas sp.]
MTAHRTLPAIASLHASRAAIAARAVQHQGLSAGASTARVLGLFGRAAGVSMWFAGQMRLLARTSRPVVVRAHGADALQAEAVTVLGPSEPLVLPNWAPMTIACEAGTVWITQGDGSDYVLRAGQRLALAPRETVIVMAMLGSAVVRRIAEPVRIRGQG